MVWSDRKCPSFWCDLVTLPIILSLVSSFCHFSHHILHHFVTFPITFFIILSVFPSHSSSFCHFSHHFLFTGSGCAVACDDVLLPSFCFGLDLQLVGAADYRRGQPYCSDRCLQRGSAEIRRPLRSGGELLLFQRPPVLFKCGR